MKNTEKNESVEKVTKPRKTTPKAATIKAETTKDATAKPRKTPSKDATTKAAATKTRTAKVKVSTTETESTPSIHSDSTSREERIAEVAYYLAEKRGFAPGHELQDWAEAEFIIQIEFP